MSPLFNPLNYPILLSNPRRLTPFSTWHEHIPFAMFLVDVLRPNVIVELGTHYGDSYCAFCQAVQELKLDSRCYAIDNWQGDPHAGSYGPEVLADLRAHHDHLYGNFSRLIRSSFDDILDHFPDESIDLLHIDGYHSYEAISHDFNSWLPKIGRGGIILFHDTNVREKDFGVWRLWEEIKRHYDHFEFIHGDGLGVLAIDNDYPDTLRLIFDTPPEDSLKIRNFFFHIGQRIVSITGAERDKEIERLRGETARQLAELVAIQDRSRRDKQDLIQKLTELQMMVDAKEREIYALSHSESYRLGLVCTWPLRKIWSAQKQLRHLFAPSSSETRYHIAKCVYEHLPLPVWARRWLQARVNSQFLPGTRDRCPTGTTIGDFIVDSFKFLQPLRVYSAPGSDLRVNLITDSVNSGSLFGGVATSIIFSALLAEKNDAKLRVITRTEKADETNVRHVLECNGINWTRNVDFIFAHVAGERAEVDVCDHDVFITTSWWTTRSAIGSINEDKVLYLLQEDERMFYPYGDDHLRCTELLKNPKLRFIINSKLLYNHFVESGFFKDARDRAYWFEPSFNEAVFFREQRVPGGGKKNFFFYARPNNQRNLFYRGLETIDRAVSVGILDPDEWEFYFVGKDIPEVTIGPSNPRWIANLSWKDYGALVRSIDLGLCLMYSPHPSYPPLDLAATGAVVVTNRFGQKRDLDMYSKNILCTDLEIESLVSGIANGVKLVSDDKQRKINYQNSMFLRDWRTSFKYILSRLT